MILILSKPGDRDTDLVIEWLNYFKTPVLRVNDEELMQGITTFSYDSNCTENSYFENSTQRVYLKDISVVWFRKFGYLRDYEAKLDYLRDLMLFLNDEFKALRELIFSLLDDKKWLFKRSLMKSKLEILNLAKNVGLQIPKTIIVTERNKLKLFWEENNHSIITKPIAEALHLKLANSTVGLSTVKVETVKNLNINFSPSLFQEYIEKEIELRVFYIMGKCYSMAIFSQSNPQTKIDFRAYDWDFPNRFIPFQLPSEIEMKIDILMKKLQLNTGSIDILKSSKNGAYYFLEVNPSGQFGMTSFPCNYDLHKIVAQNLILLNNEK
ncbi:grasp-with-spasm system ATP-grasp peptide maturase [Flavobacterium xinjiangense]|uniref:ATP-GRASP peptide maturase, grasp-with-spasm system n=1 Tax=Flavobacterium xinjiangense TaxID=178356 RepID=A0A1M7P6F0_9FLAO|nr:grasp-with-spasm system ATP-grasp peptide maturase [Flavobacterium xinjiangense]SHN12264.1 ATP-GRASP peptide maturase, grasp-with-spasm system [Flavobacterium xinjiangense]